jgi:hypothetical protein
MTADATVKAILYYKYTHDSKTSDIKTFDAKFYSEGGKPSKPTISQTAGNNTVTISGSLPNGGSNNAIKTAKISYNTGGANTDVAISSPTNGKSYSTTLTMVKDCTVTASVTCTYDYMTKSKTSDTATVSGNYYSSVKAGTVEIIDNGNNTFTIRGTKGANGNNNPAKALVLTYGYDVETNNTTTYTADGTVISLDIADSTKDTRTVYARCKTTATYGNDTYAYTDKKIVQYVAPKAPGVPSLTDSSYKNGRLTIKLPWTFSWSYARKTNNSSPIAGYRLRLYKNNTNIPLRDISGKQLSTILSGSDYVYDTESTSCTFRVDPVVHGLKPGDDIKFTICAYTKNDLDTKIFHKGKGEASDAVESSTDTVQNAGVVRIKVPERGYVEGQVWIKTSDAWVEAETVNIKTKDGWEESQ